MEGKSQQQWIIETLHNLESPAKAIRDQSEAQLAQLPNLID
jgi:conjugal transfer/entry exclusion protein